MLLEANGIAFSYNKRDNVFFDASFSVNKGEIFAILGPNGSGKSTLLNCLANLTSVSAGAIIINGRNLEEHTMPELARLISYVPQIHVPTYGFIVRDYVVMGRAPYIGFFSKPSKKDYAIADDTLEQLGINFLADKAYTEISGGERQQVNLARAIVQNPEIIMLDEPTAHLDYGNQYSVIKMIKKLSEDGYTIIITTHQPDHAILLNGTVAMLSRLGTIKKGSVQDMVQEDTLSELYNIPIKLLSVNEAARRICVPI